MKNKPILLRISFWWGAIADFVMGVLMVFPKYYLQFTNTNLQYNDSFAYGFLNGAPLMFGWTLLLIWADHKPQERKHILPITMFVVLGYIAVEIYAIHVGISTLQFTLPLFCMQGALLLMFAASLLHNRFEA
jgi:hypothetical protein